MKTNHPNKIQTSIAGVNLDIFDKRSTKNSIPPTTVLYFYLAPFLDADISEGTALVRNVVQGIGMNKKKKEKTWYYSQLNSYSKLKHSVVIIS